MKILVTVVAFACAATVVVSQSRSFTGEIMDSQCAGMHSHRKMMQGVNAKDAKDCTEKLRSSVRRQDALFDPSSNAAYQLDNQEKAAGFAGQKVSVKGTYDSGSKTIHVDSIEAR